MASVLTANQPHTPERWRELFTTSGLVGILVAVPALLVNPLLFFAFLLGGCVFTLIGDRRWLVVRRALLATAVVLVLLFVLVQPAQVEMKFNGQVQP